MRIAVFSDVHANFPALSAVADDAANQMGVGFQQCWSLGDIVGYGPHPAQALAFLRDFVAPDAWIMGNHDAMLADLILPDELNTLPDLQKVIRVKINKGDGREIISYGNFLKGDDWFKTTSMPVEVIMLNRAALQLSPEEDAFWREAFTPERAQPLKLKRDGMTCYLTHGSQADPLSRYVYGWEKDILIPRELDMLKKARGRSKSPVIQFYGHTHVPTFIRARVVNNEYEIQAEKIYPNQSFALENGYLYLINPGSVGQSRDRDPRASYVVFDTETRTVTFRRVNYDYTETARDLVIGEYPDTLIRRLQTASAAEKETPDDWLQHYDEASTK